MRLLTTFFAIAAVLFAIGNALARAEASPMRDVIPAQAGIHPEILRVS